MKESHRLLHYQLSSLCLSAKEAFTLNTLDPNLFPFHNMDSRSRYYSQVRDLGGIEDAMHHHPLNYFGHFIGFWSYLASGFSIGNHDEE